MIEDDDEDISALISAQDSTLDDSLTSLPFDIDISSQHSSPRSTRYGSYDVNPSSVSSPAVFEPDDMEVPSPIGHLSQPIFTPPPPPDSPPSSARSSAYRDAETPSTMVYNHPLDIANQSEEEEGWREWLALDSDNVDIIDPPDMKDICIGTTPRDSMSVISSRTVSSVNTAIYTESNIRNESQDDSLNNNNNVIEEFEHIFNGGEGNHPAQSPSRSITSARSSPIRFVETVSPTRDSGLSLSNNDSVTSDNRNSDYTNGITSETTNSNSTVNRIPLERSSSRNSMTSINSYRSAVNEMRLARAAELRNSQRSTTNKNFEVVTTVKVPQESHCESSVNNSSDSHISSTSAARAIHPDSNSVRHSPTKNSVSSFSSNTSSSTLSRSKYSDSTASPSRLYTIGFPVGGIGSKNSVHAVHSDSDDDSYKETNVENIPQPVDDDVGEVFEGEDIIMVVLSKESKSLGK